MASDWDHMVFSLHQCLLNLLQPPPAVPAGTYWNFLLCCLLVGWVEVVVGLWFLRFFYQLFRWLFIAEEFRFQVYPLNHLVGIVYARAMNYKKNNLYNFKNPVHHGNTEIHLRTTSPLWFASLISEEVL